MKNVMGAKLEMSLQIKSQAQNEPDERIICRKQAEKRATQKGRRKSADLKKSDGSWLLCALQSCGFHVHRR